MGGRGDIREIGSGNIGATNVLRTGSKILALLTVLCDGGKGIVAILLATRLGDSAVMVAAIAVIIGHIFPIWLGFKGGKGKSGPDMEEEDPYQGLGYQSTRGLGSKPKNEEPTLE